jgi:molybdopterin synthase sulfur carrier subunit
MKIKYFAWLQDKVGIEEESIALPAEVNDVSSLIEWMSGRGQRYAEAFEFAEVIKVVINQKIVNNDHSIKEDDEIIFIPPIAGG